jgi:glyoxylase-like metal-dependent hydrolase (beta-lactamase superfamily II)
VGRAPAVELAPRVWRIPTTPADLVNTFAFVEEDGSVTLVDCGYRYGSSARIRAGLAAIGRDVRDVQRIVLTHAHGDHAGGAAALVRASGVAGVVVHEDDAGYARRGEGPPRDVRYAGPTWLRPLGDRMSAFPPVDVAGTLADGDVLPVVGGLRVVHTPGHTPGHASLVHDATGVLITGDAIWNMRSRMTWPVPAFCTDVRLTQQTADVLGELDYAVAAFTHGPEIRDAARESVRGFLRKARRR